MSKKDVLVCFVCTGNTCRSPMAEYYFNNINNINSDKPDNSGVSAVSRGLSVGYSAPMALNAKKTLVSNNIIRNIDEILHESKQIDEKIIEEADYIYGITEAHSNILKENFPQFAAKIFAMPEDVGDPYGGSIEIYEKCFEKIRKAVDMITEELKDAE